MQKNIAQIRVHKRRPIMFTQKALASLKRKNRDFQFSASLFQASPKITHVFKLAVKYVSVKLQAMDS